MKERELKYGECIHHENLASCEICNTNWNPKVEMPTIKTLLDLLALHGGKIVSTASLDVGAINQARVSGRLYVDENSYGFVWEPKLKRLPQTDAEIEFFEKWWPLHPPMPDNLKNWNPTKPKIKKSNPKRDN